MDIKKLAALEREIENFIAERPFNDFFMLLEDISDFKPENYEGNVQEYYDLVAGWVALNEIYQDRTKKGIEKIIKKIQNDNWEVINHAMINMPVWFKEEIIDQFNIGDYIAGTRFKAEYALDFCVIKGRKTILNIVSLREVLIDALKKLIYTPKNVSGHEVTTIDISQLNFYSHKIVLMHELGIIDYLRDKYFDVSNPDHKANTKDLANLLNILTGINSETLRAGITNYGNPKSKANILTNDAIKEVNKILIDFNIPHLEQIKKEKKV